MKNYTTTHVLLLTYIISYVPQRVNTIEEALIACGVNAINSSIGGQSNSKHLLDDMFDKKYLIHASTKTFADMDAEFKGYTDLTLTQGHVCLAPGTKCKVQAFVQWG